MRQARGYVEMREMRDWSRIHIRTYVLVYICTYVCILYTPLCTHLTTYRLLDDRGNCEFVLLRPVMSNKYVHSMYIYVSIFNDHTFNIVIINIIEISRRRKSACHLAFPFLSSFTINRNIWEGFISFVLSFHLFQRDIRGGQFTIHRISNFLQI